MFAEHETDFITIITFMLYSTPLMIYWVLPFSICLGILATQASFSRHVETIAMQACSVSTLRIYMPYLMVGLLSAFFMAYLSFYLYPQAQKKADKIENIYIKKKDVQGSFSMTGGRFKVGSYVYYVEHLDITQGIMRNVNCYNIASGRLVSVAHAVSATWVDNRWAGEGITYTTLDENGITTINDKTSLPLSQGPDELVMAQPRPDVLTITDMKQYLDQLERDHIHSPGIETYYQSRISFAFTPLIMTILVLPFGMRFPRAGGIARGIATGLVLGLAYWSFHSAMTSLGASGTIPPVIASWSSNIIAIILGLILLSNKRGAYG